MSKMLDSKTLLAKLMATEDLIVEQRKVSTAHFDLKNRILCLPILKNDLEAFNYDHFIGHEVGHALYTPGEDYKIACKELIGSIVNVVEDVRIERKIKYKYPGLKNSFVKSYSNLIERNFFGTDDTDLNDLNFIDRANLYYKGGPSQGIEFSDEEMPYLELMNSTETFAEVVEVTKKIIAFMKEKAKEQLKTSSGEQKSESGGNEEGEKSESKTETEEIERVEAEAGGKQKADENESSDTEPTDEEVLEQIKSKTDELFKENEKQLFDYDAGDVFYPNLPDIDLNRVIVPHTQLYKFAAESYHPYHQSLFDEGQKNFVKYRNDLNRMVSYLVKEFELRKNADQMKRAAVSNTGELNMSKIYSYKFNEDIFKKITTMPEGKSHGLVMFLDWSGSMRNELEQTAKQLLALIMFCKKVNIPYEVYAFGDGSRMNHSPVVFRKPGDLRLEDFTLYNIFSSKMSASQFKYAASCFSNKSPADCLCRAMDMSGTPLNEAIVAAMKIVPEFQKKNNLQIVNTIFLSDGESNSNSVMYDNSASGREIGIHGKDTYLRDPKTRIEEKVTNGRSRFGSWTISLTNALLRMLKRKTNGNVVGFYIVPLRHFERAYRTYGPYNPNTTSTEMDQLRTKFRTEKNMILEPKGFDEYYLLKSDGIGADDLLDFDSVPIKTNTNKSIVTAFKKFNKTRLESRVVLNRFINLIT